MSRISRWIYRDMLDVYYDSEQPLPLDLDVLCDQIGVEQDDERRVVERLLKFKFTQAEDGYHHEICDRVIEEYRAKAETAKANGKKGGRPPKKPKANPEKPSGFPSGSNPDAIGNPEQTGSQANQEPITNNQEPEARSTPMPDADAPSGDVERRAPRQSTEPRGDAGSEVREVFAYWQQTMSHPQSKLDGKRERAIKARLKDGYTVGQLCSAIDGCRRSPHHMGQNESRTVYDDIELICRDAPKVDGFIAKAQTQPGIDPGLQRQVDILKDWN